jgi:hypothetical protein
MCGPAEEKAKSKAMAEMLRKLAKWLLIVALVFVVVALIFIIGKLIGGHHRLLVFFIGTSFGGWAAGQQQRAKLYAAAGQNRPKLYVE